MSNLPSTVSIIMPVYNTSLYLQESIESILTQTFPVWELIIVNDASTDTSKDIALEYAKKDPRIKVIDNVYEKGLAGALNSGLDISTGDYIARADGDDINKPNRLAIQYTFLKRHPEIDIVGGGYKTFGGKNSRTIFHPASSIEIAWRFLTDTYFCHPTVMFRRKVLVVLPHYPSTGSEDFGFFSALLHSHQGANIPQVLLDYREHDANYSKYARTDIEASVHETFLKNFRHYLGTIHNSELYFAYVKRRELITSHCFRMLSIEYRLINAIRRSYDLSAMNPSFISVLCKATAKVITATILSVIKK